MARQPSFGGRDRGRLVTGAQGKTSTHMESADMRGKRALVTGGSRGIGRSIALMLGERGADVVINHLQNDEAAAEVRALIEKAGRRAHVVKANLGKPPAIQEMFEEVRE